MFTRRSLFGMVAGLFGARKVAPAATPAVTRLDVLYGLRAKPELICTGRAIRARFREATTAPFIWTGNIPPGPPLPASILSHFRVRDSQEHINRMRSAMAERIAFLKGPSWPAGRTRDAVESRRFIV